MADDTKAKIKAVFNSINLSNDTHLKSLGRMVSRIPSGPPLITIQPKNKTTLSLKFIRSTNGYPFKNLLSGLNTYAKDKGFSKIELENDALFSKGRCQYRALYYRVFRDNKNSLYVSQGYMPASDISGYKETVYNFTIGQAKELVNSDGFPAAGETFVTALNNLPESDDEKRFGEWLTNLDCMTMREFFINLQAMAAQFSKFPKEKIEAAREADPDGAKFLIALRMYELAHSSLIRNVQAAGGKCTRSLRRKSLPTRRKHFHSRKTRKSRKYH